MRVLSAPLLHHKLTVLCTLGWCRLGGVPLAYSRVQRVHPGGYIVEDQPHLHVSLQVDLIVFTPQAGSMLRATVNKVRPTTDRQTRLALSLGGTLVACKSPGQR